MDAARYREIVRSLRLGKRLPEALYLHVSAIPFAPPDARAIVSEAVAMARIAAEAYNVVKLSLRAPRVSLLNYERFFEDGFPSLVEGSTVDLAGGRCSARSYRSERSSPVLHRKEELLVKDHPMRPEFEALTAAAERLGLFEDAPSIGLRGHWEARLKRIGVTVVGNRLIETARVADARAPDPGAVLRHRTALTRHGLSTPMQALWRHGFLETGSRVFDYGCGRGDDVRILAGKGLDAGSWDPHFAPERPRTPADVVNLGFVLNVIEDPVERGQALRAAWGLTRKVLAVAVLIGGRTAYERYRLFRDGVLTQRGTFQKYFAQDELREYLEDELEREPVAIAPGLFFVFREDREEQRFLAGRQTPRQPVPRTPRPARVPPARAEPRPKRGRTPKPMEVHHELVEAYWTACLALARPPDATEFDRIGEIEANLGRAETVFRRLATERYAEFDAARRDKMTGLAVYLALNLFERRRSFAALPDGLQRDVRAFWGSYASARDQARALLFSAGDVEAIRQSSAEAAAAGLGYLYGDHSLQLRTSSAERLPAVLRAYLGCASRLYGEIDGADLVKIHIRSGKVTLTTYDDFDGSPIPLLIERVKIDLRRQDIQFFQYGADVPPQPLYLKSRYMSEADPRYQEQKTFDASLSGLGVFSFEGFGPSLEDLRRGFDSLGVAVDGFTLRRLSEPHGT